MSALGKVVGIWRTVHLRKVSYFGSPVEHVCLRKFGHYSVGNAEFRLCGRSAGFGSPTVPYQRGWHLFRNDSYRILWSRTFAFGQRRNVSTDPGGENTKSSVSLSVFDYISQSSPVSWAKDCIVHVHDTIGLPWWATIILITFSLRASLTLPLAIYQTYILAKVENITLLEMPECAKKIKSEIDSKVRELKWDKRKASLNYKIAVKKQWDTLIVRDNCHPFKATVTLWVQIPTWIFFSAALRNLAYMMPVNDAAAQIAYLELSVGGFLWIPNLTLPDGSLILPIALGLSNLAIIEIQSMMRIRKATRFQKIVTNFFRGFSIALIPISATVPSCVCLYWTTSSILGLGQNLLLMSNRVKSFCGIPDTPTTYDYPYAQLMAELKRKFIRDKT